MPARTATAITDTWFQGRIADSAFDLERKITQEDEARQLKRLDTVRPDRNQAAVTEVRSRPATWKYR